MDKLTWIENSDNNVLLATGTSYVKMLTVENNEIINIKTIDEFDTAKGEHPGDIHIKDNNIYYAQYNTDGETTTADLYKYSGTSAEKITTGNGIYNIESIGDTLYYIRNSGIYKFENGTETAVGFDNVTSFDVIYNENYCSMIMSISDGAKSDLYISTLNNDEWSQSEKFTDLGKHIRNYSPFMYDDGTINVAVSATEVIDDVESETKYGNTSLFVLNQCDYFDISSTYVYYEEDEVVPNSDMNLYFDVNNDSSDTISSVNVTLTDGNGNTLDEQTLSCNIAPFSSEQLSIKYHLPESISKTQLNLTISTEKEEKSYSNNTVSTEFGYANICIAPIECSIKNDNTAEISTTVSNTGFTNAENVTVKIYNGDINGDILEEKFIEKMSVGESATIEYTFPAELMVDTSNDAMNAVYIVAESASKESIISDNTEKATFDSFICTINEITIDGNAVSVDITKNSTDKGTLVVASYNQDGRFIDATFSDVTSTNLYTTNLNTSDAAYVSAFIWENVQSLNSLAEKLTKYIE